MNFSSSDPAREIFFLYDVEAVGKLTDEGFYRGLLAGGAALSESEFKSGILAEFGSHPTLVVFKQALQKARGKAETVETLKAKFSLFGESISGEALRHCLGEKVEEVIKLLGEDLDTTINVDTLCRKLIPLNS